VEVSLELIEVALAEIPMRNVPSGFRQILAKALISFVFVPPAEAGGNLKTNSAESNF
jgi:hypothetical protein